MSKKTIVARSEDSIDMIIYNDPNAGLIEDVHLPHGTSKNA